MQRKVRDIIDFNDCWHRIRSASAAFQKGIYHLYFLSEPGKEEPFAGVLRIYQCLFQLCLTHLLLDFEYKLDIKKIDGRLRRLCKNRNAPSRSEIDPAAIIKHSVFEKGQWEGRVSRHPLHKGSKNVLTLYHRTVDARHNLMYRPFMLETHWEDCTLIRLLSSIPTSQEVEAAYKEFLQTMIEMSKIERQELPKRIEEMKRAREGHPHVTFSPFYAGSFLSDLFKPYRDIDDKRPTESLLLTYVRMLNPQNAELLNAIAKYRNKLIESNYLIELFGLQGDWNAEEFLSG